MLNWHVLVDQIWKDNLLEWCVCEDRVREPILLGSANCCNKCNKELVFANNPNFNSNSAQGKCRRCKSPCGEEQFKCITCSLTMNHNAFGVEQRASEIEKRCDTILNERREREDEKDNVLHWNKIKQERLKDMQQKLEGRIEGLNVSKVNANALTAGMLGKINQRISKRMESSRKGVKAKKARRVEIVG